MVSAVIHSCPLLLCLTTVSSYVDESRQNVFRINRHLRAKDLDLNCISQFGSPRKPHAFGRLLDFGTAYSFRTSFAAYSIYLNFFHFCSFQALH